MGAKETELTLDQALEKIQDELIAASGYPDNTVTDGSAFAYGLVLGTISLLRNEWKEKLK